MLSGISSELFLRFGAALGIGVLIGLQREYAYDSRPEEMFAGVRTFSLLGLLGCSAALLADLMDAAWVFIGLILALGALIAVAYFISSWRQGDIGLTTEVAALLTVLIGGLCYWNQLALAAAVGVATTVLLALKLELHSFVRQLTRQDIFATLRFAVITAIILPVLPNRGFAPPPLDVLNPYRIWLMVVLISGISFLGYVLIKLVGARHGIGLTGLLGGLASSTAVTLSFAQRSLQKEQLSRPFALAVIVAWTTVFPRILVEIWLTNRALLGVLWPPMLAAGLAGLAYALYLFLGERAHDGEEVEFTNPFELGPAIRFGMLYAGVLVLSRAVEISPVGDAGIYLSSLVAGLVDVDAITLSLAQLSARPDGLEILIAGRAIVLAAMANTTVKGLIVLLAGSAAIRRYLAPGFALILLAGIGVAFLT